MIYVRTASRFSRVMSRDEREINLRPSSRLSEMARRSRAVRIDEDERKNRAQKFATATGTLQQRTLPRTITKKLATPTQEGAAIIKYRVLRKDARSTLLIDQIRSNNYKHTSILFTTIFQSYKLQVIIITRYCLKYDRKYNIKQK